MKHPTHGGGWQAIRYTFRKALESGGLLRMWSAMRSKNTCKTCALGMGGQKGGMVNEAREFPEMCKKSVQAMASDLQKGIRYDYFDTHSLADLEQKSSLELEYAGRLRQPLYAGPNDTHYRPIEWEEAFVRITDKLKATQPDESFFYFSGRSSNEAGFVTQLFARMYGTNNINNCSYYCHQASGVGLTNTIGNSTATVSLEDTEQCDTLFIIGANPASNHPRFMKTCMNLKRRGGKIIVINPLKEIGLKQFNVPSDPKSLFFGTRIADEYLQVKIGGDMALLAGIAKSVLAQKKHDAGFISQRCEHFDNYRASVDACAWDDIVAESGIERAVIEQIASLYSNSTASIFAWAMGITHHTNGTATVQAIANLAMLRGMIGKSGAGLLPLRGHSNVQGMGTIGVVPTLKATHLVKYRETYGVDLPSSKGLDTLACMEAAHAGKMRFAWSLGGNLYDSNPDTTFAREAFEAIDLVVYQNTTLNATHICGRGKETIVLPVLARDEEPCSSTQESMFSYIRLSDGGERRHLGPLPEASIISRVAHDMLGSDGPFDWQSFHNHDAVRRVIAQVIPNLAPIENIGHTKKEFHIDGRHLVTKRFPTGSGRAVFHAFALTTLNSLPEEHFRLMTIRSEGQFNAVVYEEYDRYRGQERRDIILLNPNDMKRMGIKKDQAVTITSTAGKIERYLARPYDITVGCAAMYYPESNILVPRTVDPLSRTPAYKNVPVTIAPSQ